MHTEQTEEDYQKAKEAFARLADLTKDVWDDSHLYPEFEKQYIKLTKDLEPAMPMQKWVAWEIWLLGREYGRGEIEEVNNL